MWSLKCLGASREDLDQTAIQEQSKIYTVQSILLYKSGTYFPEITSGAA